MTAAEFSRALSPFERSVFSIARARQSWDPALIRDELGRVRHDGLRPSVEVVGEAIARIRFVLGFLASGGQAETRDGRVGNGVTTSGSYPAATKEKETAMGEVTSTPDRASVGFADRIQAEARQEADRVLGELKRLRFDAHQIVRVLRALDLGVPEDLASFVGDAPQLGATLERISLENRETAVEESPETESPETERKPEPRRPEKTVLPPGQEFPEHLAKMPAAQGRGPLSPRLVAAKKQRQVLDALAAQKNAVAGEIAREVEGIPVARVSDYLRMMEDCGLVRRTGRNRHDPVKLAEAHREGRHPGKASVEYVAVQESAEPGLSERPASESSSVDAGAERAAELERSAAVAVRDFAVSAGDAFSPRQVMEETGLEESDVRTELTDLLRRGVIAFVGMDDLELYEYRKPDGPGAAADLDAKRRERGVFVGGTGSSSGGAPVAGTGGKVRAANPDVQKLIDAARQQGCKISHAPNGHFEVRAPNGARLLISSTPSNPRTILNDRARLRREGKVNV